MLDELSNSLRHENRSLILNTKPSTSGFPKREVNVNRHLQTPISIFLYFNLLPAEIQHMNVAR